MQKELSTYLKEKIRGIDLKNIENIFLFGSAVKGKEFPEDIDICIVFKDKVHKEILSGIEHKLKEHKVHISSLTVNDFFKKPHPLAKTIFLEGLNIFNRKPFINNFVFSSYVLYSYDLSKLKPSEKVRFVYLLKGRNSKEGIIKKLGGEWIADSCFMIPIKKDSEMLIILKKWMIPFKRKGVLVS